MKMHRLRTAGVAAALAAIIALPLAQPTIAAPGDPGQPRFSAGAPGVGEAYFPNQGNGGFDVQHYDIRLTYNPDTTHLAATTTVSAVATQDLDQFDLDFAGPAISKLTVNGKAMNYQRNGDELVITPRPKPKTGQKFTIVVTYAGVPPVITDPDGSSEGWVPTDDGAFVAGEPMGAMAWFPGSNHPTDKATFTFTATVPEGKTAVGNGQLLSQTTKNGWTTFIWDSTEPMATYLATVTIGNFTVTQSTTAGGVPIYVAVDPTQAARSVRAVAAIPDIIDFFTTVFGPYPFASTGAIIDDAPDVGYALETQTKPIFDSAPSVGTMAHELAHQWYGDSVSVEQWSDIWLNEGFATYASWLYTEHTGGTTPQATFESRSNYGRSATASFWQIPMIDPGPIDMFSSVPYNRGAMTLQALRVKIGDAAFFRLIKEWAALHQYGNANTSDLIQLAEKESGMDLGHFFDVWVYQTGKPTSW